MPNKVKHFAWKACRNILDTKENLWRRNITNDGVCESCGKFIESACHMFWFCDQAKEVWSCSKLILPLNISPSWEFMDAMWQLQGWSEAVPGLLECTIMICWGIWKNRNEVRHGGKRKNGAAIVQMSLSLLDEFQLANDKEQVTQTQEPHVVKWIPPKPGKLQS